MTEPIVLHQIFCSNSRCEARLLRKSRGDGMWRFAIRTLKAKDDGTGIVAVCKSCNEETEIPLVFALGPIEDDIMKGEFVMHGPK